MALVPSTLASQIEAALLAAKANPSPTASTQLANDLATAIDAYVKTATVSTVVTGTAVGGFCLPNGPITPVPPAGVPAGATVTASGVGTLA
jgi:hypothetical protein